MKTKFITSVMVIVFASASLFAADSAATIELLNQKGSSIYKVVYKAPGIGKAVLKISNRQGLVFSESINFTNGFAYPIDFKNMSDGEYTVEVLSKAAKFRQTVTLAKAKPLAYVRVTEQANKKELLTIVSQAPADFTIRVYDKWNNEVFTKAEVVKTEYGVVFNMENMATGYTIEVTEASGAVVVVRK
jgi:protease II